MTEPSAVSCPPAPGGGETAFWSWRKWQSGYDGRHYERTAGAPPADLDAEGPMMANWRSRALVVLLGVGWVRR